MMLYWMLKVIHQGEEAQVGNVMSGNTAFGSPLYERQELAWMEHPTTNVEYIIRREAEVRM